MAKSKRSIHVGKTMQERSAYQRYITRLDSQPTIDESADFDTSLDSREELSEATIKRKRETPFSQKLNNYVSNNWIGWILAGLTIIGLYILYDVRVNTEIINANLSHNQMRIEQIDSFLENINNEIDEIGDINHTQDLKIQKINLELENISDILDGMQ